MAATNVDFVTNPTKQTVLWYLISVPNIGRNKNLCKSVVVFDCDSADLPFSIWIFMSLSDYFYILILLISFPNFLFLLYWFLHILFCWFDRGLISIYLLLKILAQDNCTLRGCPQTTMKGIWFFWPPTWFIDTFYLMNAIFFQYSKMAISVCKNGQFEFYRCCTHESPRECSLMKSLVFWPFLTYLPTLSYSITSIFWATLDPPTYPNMRRRRWTFP